MHRRAPAAPQKYLNASARPYPPRSKAIAVKEFLRPRRHRRAPRGSCPKEALASSAGISDCLVDRVHRSSPTYDNVYSAERSTSTRVDSWQKCWGADLHYEADSIRAAFRFRKGRVREPACRNRFNSGCFCEEGSGILAALLGLAETNAYGHLNISSR